MHDQPIRADGYTRVRATPEAARAAILDPAVLARIIPGVERVVRAPDGTFIATLALGVGAFRGRQTVALHVDEETRQGLAVSGRAAGPFGTGQATGHLELLPEGCGGTLVRWAYDGIVRGPVTLAGSRLLRLAAAAFAGRVFAQLRRALERRPE